MNVSTASRSPAGAGPPADLLPRQWVLMWQIISSPHEHRGYLYHHISRQRRSGRHVVACRRSVSTYSRPVAARSAAAKVPSPLIGRDRAGRRSRRVRRPPNGGHRRPLAGIRLALGEVTAVAPDNDRFPYADPEGKSHELRYGRLILAAATSTSCYRFRASPGTRTTSAGWPKPCTCGITSFARWN
jgi:hypothetical protein